MADPKVQVNLLPCPYCAANVWVVDRLNVAYLLHKDDCFLGGETFIHLRSRSAEQWNNRVEYKIQPPVSPVSENPGEQEFYDRAEASIIQGSER